MSTIWYVNQLLFYSNFINTVESQNVFFYGMVERSELNQYADWSWESNNSQNRTVDSNCIGQLSQNGVQK